MQRVERLGVEDDVKFAQRGVEAIGWYGRALQVAVRILHGELVADETAADAMVEPHDDQPAGERRAGVGRGVMVDDLVVDGTLWRVVRDVQDLPAVVTAFLLGPFPLGPFSLVPFP